MRGVHLGDSVEDQGFSESVDTRLRQGFRTEDEKGKSGKSQVALDSQVIDRQRQD